MKLSTLEAALMKSITTAAGQGGDFIPEELADDFIRYVREKTFCRQMFRAWRMGSKTRDVPKMLSGMTVWYEPSEITTARETSFTTGTITLTAKKFLAQVLYSTEIEEDSSFSIDDIIVDDFTNAVAEAEEQAMLVGDTDHTAAAATVAAATDANWFTKDCRLIFDGLYTLAQSSGAASPVNAGGASLTETHIRYAIHRLGKYGRNFKNDVLFVDSFNALELLDRDCFKTLEKYGPNATIFSGEVGSVWGQVKVINSSFLDEGTAVMTHAGNPVIGDRRRIKIKDEEVIADDAKRVVTSERLDFTVQYAAALVRIYNLASGNIAS